MEESVGKKLFKPGKSGNPLGRPKGTRNKMKVLAEGLMGENAKKIVKTVIQKALEGDVKCLQMCMDRILPAQRAIDSDKAEKHGQTINIVVEGMSRLPVVMSDMKDIEDVEEEGST